MKRRAVLASRRCAMPDVSLSSHVRLDGLAARRDLNGHHATVATPAHSSEAAELELKGRIKVRTLSETLSVKQSNATPVDVFVDAASISYRAAKVIFSNEDVLITALPNRGYGMIARRDVVSGESLLREAPIAVARATTSQIAGDQVCARLFTRLAPYAREADKGGVGKYSDEARAILDQILARVAELCYAALDSRSQRRWMSLCDSFTSKQKTVAGCYRSNLFRRTVDGPFGDDMLGGCLYELCSVRARHAPHASNPTATTLSAPCCCCSRI